MNTRLEEFSCQAKFPWKSFSDCCFARKYVCLYILKDGGENVYMIKKILNFVIIQIKPLHKLNLKKKELPNNSPSANKKI